MTEMGIDELTHRIIGCAVEVHKAIGSSFQKEVYKNCLASEFSLQGIEFEEDKEMIVYYKGQEVGELCVDFLVEEKVIVEIRTIEKLEDKHRLETIQHCKIFRITDGLILNFGAQPLDCKRVYSKNN